MYVEYFNSDMERLQQVQYLDSGESLFVKFFKEYEPTSSGSRVAHPESVILRSNSSQVHIDVYLDPALNETLPHVYDLSLTGFPDSDKQIFAAMS